MCVSKSKRNDQSYLHFFFSITRDCELAGEISILQSEGAANFSGRGGDIPRGQSAF